MAEEVSESRGYVLPAADHSQEIVNQLNMQRYYGSFCDITITVNNYDFKLHKCVLAAACPKLYAILYPLRENYQNNLSLKEVTVTGFKSLVEFMYTGHVKLDTLSLVQDLYQAARYFEMGQIEKQCIDFIKNELDINPYNEQNPAEPVYRDSVDIPHAHNEQNSIAPVYRESVDVQPTHNEQNNPIEPVYRDNSVDIPPAPQENSSLEAVMMHPYNSLTVPPPNGGQVLPLQQQVPTSHPQPMTMSTHPMSQPVLNIVPHQPQLQDVSAPHTPQSGVIPATPAPSMNMPQSSSATNMSTFDANYIDDYLKLIETLQNEQQQQQQPILETHNAHGNHIHSMQYNSHRSNTNPYQRSGSEYMEHTQQQQPIQPKTISFPNQTLQGNTYSAEDVRRTILSVLSQERFDEDVSNEAPMKPQAKEPVPLMNVVNFSQSQKGKEQHLSNRPAEDNALVRLQLQNTSQHGRANMEAIPDSASESENEERFQEAPFQLPQEKQSVPDNETSFCMTIPPMHDQPPSVTINSIATNEMVAHQYARTDFLDGLHNDGKPKDIVAEQLSKEQARLHGKKRILHKAKKAKENFDKSKNMQNLQTLNPPVSDLTNVVEEMIKERGKEFLSQEGIEDISDADEEISNVQKTTLNLDFRKNHDYFERNVGDESLGNQDLEECIERELVIDTESNNEGHVTGQEVNSSGVKVRLPHRHTKMKLKLNVKSPPEKQPSVQENDKPAETRHEVSKTENLKMKPLKKRIKHFKKYKCDQCAREFLRQDYLDKHLAMHEKTSLHKCPYCTMKYIRIGELTRHLRTHQIVTFKCKDCDFESTETKKFRRHCISEHDNHKPYYCDQEDCEYSTNKPCNLNKHQLIHGDKKMFSCSYCKKEFTQQNGLNSHYKSCLRKKSYLCDVCGQGFNHLQGMKLHRNTHTGAKPYQCEQCEASFSDQRNFKRHLRIHQQVYPYPCTHCERKFRHSNSLKSHLKSAHKISKLKTKDKDSKKAKKKEK